jgi:hypothetical protein
MSAMAMRPPGSGRNTSRAKASTSAIASRAARTTRLARRFNRPIADIMEAAIAELETALAELERVNQRDARRGDG